MARFLGIDYGTKNIGLALSDDEGRIAFPHKTIENTRDIIGYLEELCKKEHISEVVVGIPRSMRERLDTHMTNEVQEFIKKLKETNTPVECMEEFLSTKEALHNPSNKEHIDSSAAALILQSYLDRRKDML